MWGLVTSFCVVLFYLFRLSGAIIRFGDKYRFCSSGVFSRNLALYANSIILSIDFLSFDVNSPFSFMVFLKNICLLSVLKYLHLYSIWKDVSRQFDSHDGSQCDPSHSFI